MLFGAEAMIEGNDRPCLPEGGIAATPNSLISNHANLKSRGLEAMCGGK
jgi:hypothetical protein